MLVSCSLEKNRNKFVDTSNKKLTLNTCGLSQFKGYCFLNTFAKTKTNKMKKLFVLPLALLILASSCKKSSSSGAGSITATVDGTATSFSNTATAVESSATNNGITAYSLLIVGFQGSPSSSSSITLTIGSDAPFGADSTYTGLASPSDNLAEVTY